MIICVVNEKGGVGKTTLAAHLAIWRAHRGRDVLLIDTDTQASAMMWAQIRREAGIEPKVACVALRGKGLTAEVSDLAKRYQDVVIDAGGRDSLELRAALLVSQTAVIPVQASQLDLWAVDRMAELIGQAQALNTGLLATLVLSRAATNPAIKDGASAMEFLAEYPSLGLAPGMIRDRSSYRRTIAEGRTVLDNASDPKATREVEELASQIWQE